MARRVQISSGDEPVRRQPASTPEGREAQMIHLADQLAERQLLDGTASAQVITHYLKMGSSRERKEQAKLDLETELVRARTEQIAGMQRQEELFAKAIRFMTAYQGGPLPAELTTDEVE